LTSKGPCVVYYAVELDGTSRWKMPPKSKRVLPGKRYPLNMRTTKELRDKIDLAARASGRSLVQEVESRLERLFQQEEIEELNGTVRLQVRFPERLWRRLEQAAEHNKWSMNTEIFDRLDVSFQREDQEEMKKKAERDAVQAQQEVTKLLEEATRKLLAAELSKSKHESPPKGEDSK
jgi:predicted HicB family RNase H-like nuclease